MENPYAHVIAELEAEIERLQEAVRVLKQRNPGDLTEGTTRKPPEEDRDLTNDEIVDRVLSEAKVAISVAEIIQRAHILLGKELNPNSVRWVLHHGVNDQRFQKEKRGGRAKYKIHPGRRFEEEN